MARAKLEESTSRMENLRPRLTNDIHVMLVGPAGAGKSSLIKSLKQLCKSSDGSLPSDYSYIPPSGGGMLGGHTLMRQTVDSINTLTFTNNSGWHDWSNKTAVEGLTAQIQGEKAIDDIDRTDTERDSSLLKHPMVPHLAFSKVDCIAVVLNGQAGIKGIENLHELVETCRKNTRRMPSFVITHKDTMSVEQIEHMKTALDTEGDIDPDNIFFIENVTAPNQEIVDFDWKSRLCEFLGVCADDGEVGAASHLRRENTMLMNEKHDYEYEMYRIEKQIVDAKHDLQNMNLRATKGQLDADTPNIMVYLAQKQVDMLTSELKHAEEMHPLKTECNKARQSIRESSKQRAWANKWHQLQIIELQQKLQQSTTICDSLLETKATLQGQLKDERHNRNHTETTLKEKYNIALQTHNVYKQRMEKVQETAQQQLEQTKSEYERERPDLVQKMETEAKLKDQLIQQQERVTLKLRNKIQLESHRRSEEQKKMKKEGKSLRKKYNVLVASLLKPKADLLDTCPNPDNLDQTDVLKLEKEPPNDDFADKLNHIADDLFDEAKIDSLGGQLGIIQGDIERALMTNVRFNRVTSDGTRHMLKQWREGVSREDERIELRNALVAAKLQNLADHYFRQVNVAEDEDQVDCELALPNVCQENDAKIWRTEIAAPTPEDKSANMDTLHGERVTNVKYAQGESQITDKFDKTPSTGNESQTGYEEVQEIVTLREIKEDRDNERVSSKTQDKIERDVADYSFRKLRGSDKEKKHDRSLKVENHEKMQRDESSHLLTSSSSKNKTERCLCC